MFTIKWREYLYKHKATEVPSTVPNQHKVGCSVSEISFISFPLKLVISHQHSPFFLVRISSSSSALSCCLLEPFHHCSDASIHPGPFKVVPISPLLYTSLPLFFPRVLTNCCLLLALFPGLPCNNAYAPYHLHQLVAVSVSLHCHQSCLF